MESVFYGFEIIKQKIMSTEKDLNYWKANAEEDYKQVPISVLRYITELEREVKNCSIPLVSGCLPDESELSEALDTAIYKSDCSTKPWIKEFKEQLKLSGYEIIETNNR